MFKSAEELWEHVGRKEYDELKKTFGGQRIYINQETKRFDNPYFKMPVAERNALLLADFQRGLKPRHLSKKYGLQISYVRKLLHILKKKDVAHDAE
jgi:Mor family transcriptional regulator